MNRNEFKLPVLLALLSGTPAGALAENLAESRDCVIGPHQVVDVSSAVPGLLEAVTVERSDTVSAGQLIARLESRVEEASLALADAWASIESEVRIEETTRALDRRREVRISQLYASRAAALDDKDKAETEAALASLRLHQAREKRWIRELDAHKAEAVVERRHVRSPVDGVVVERYRAAGEYVENQPVVRIAQLDPLQVETILPMKLFGTVSEGMVAEVRPENDAQASHRAVVRVVDRLGDAASGTFGVRLSLANPGNRIPAGLKCSLTFLEGVHAAVPERPERAPPPPTDMPPTEIPATAIDAPPGAPAQEVVPEIPVVVASAVQAMDPVQEPAIEDPASETFAVAPPPVVATVDVPVTAREATGSIDGGADGSAQTCMSVGPLDSVAAAAALADALASRGSPATVERREVQTLIGYIVVTPPEADLDAAHRLERELERAGVRDRQVMWRGDFARRVSMGVYAGSVMAERRREEVAALGVEAQVLERSRRSEQWWVRTRVPDAAAGADPVGDLALDVAVTPESCDADGIRSAEVSAEDGAAS